MNVWKGLLVTVRTTMHMRALVCTVVHDGVFFFFFTSWTPLDQYGELSESSGIYMASDNLFKELRENQFHYSYP